MPQYVISYFATAIVFLAIDYIWLSKVAMNFYSQRLGDLLLEKPNLMAAGAFYLVYILGVLVFSVSPALKIGSAQHALMYGCLFGFFAYATYDMTNYATLRNWPLSLSLIDIVWGTLLTGISALAGYHITRLILPE